MLFKRQDDFDQDKPRSRLGSIPIMGNGYLFKVTNSTTATAIGLDVLSISKSSRESSLEVFESEETEDGKSIKICHKCDFKTKNAEELTSHIEMNHQLPCKHCDTISENEQDRNEHMANNQIPSLVQNARKHS